MSSRGVCPSSRIFDFIYLYFFCCVTEFSLRRDQRPDKNIKTCIKHRYSVRGSIVTLVSSVPFKVVWDQHCVPCQFLFIMSVRSFLHNQRQVYKQYTRQLKTIFCFCFEWNKWFHYLDHHITTKTSDLRGQDENFRLFLPNSNLSHFQWLKKVWKQWVIMLEELEQSVPSARPW